MLTQGEKNYLCEHCGRSFASANLLKSHVHYQHNNQLDMIECGICGKSFTKKSRFEFILLFSPTSTRVNQNFPSRLEIHMRIHSDTRPYLCSVPDCGKRFHTNGNLRKHSFIHTGEKPHKCGICDKSFAQVVNLVTKFSLKLLFILLGCLIQSTNLRLHMRTHQQLLDKGQNFNSRVRKPEAVFPCDFCPMTFHRIRHFNAHRATHTGEPTTLPCTICQQQFPNIKELKDHKKTQHPGTVRNQSSYQTNVCIIITFEKQVHQCPLCDKSFFKKTAMQRHQASHTEESVPKPYFPCQHCNSRFTTSAARTVHERIHTGERPFECPTCSKSFTSKVIALIIQI